MKWILVIMVYWWNPDGVDVDHITFYDKHDCERVAARIRSNMNARRTNTIASVQTDCIAVQLREPNFD